MQLKSLFYHLLHCITAIGGKVVCKGGTGAYKCIAQIIFLLHYCACSNGCCTAKTCLQTAAIVYSSKSRHRFGFKNDALYNGILLPAA